MKLLFLFGEGSWKTSLRKGLNSIIFCGEENLVAAAPLYFCVRVEEVFMAFWDLNPLDILRQSPSITQLDHERQQQPSHRTLEPKRKREEWRLSSRHKSCYGEGWRSTHFSDIFYPQAPKGSMVYSNQLSTYLSSRYKLLFSTISTTTTGITLLAAKNPEKNDQNWQCSISIVLLLTYDMCWCFLKMHNTYELPHT